MYSPCCPKCKSQDFTGYAVEECELGAKFREGIAVSNFLPSAMPVRLSAHGSCDNCGHEWKFKDKWAI